MNQGCGRQPSGGVKTKMCLRQGLLISPPLVQVRRGRDFVMGSDQSIWDEKPSQYRLTDFLLEFGDAKLGTVRNKHVNTTGSG